MEVKDLSALESGNLSTISGYGSRIIGICENPRRKPRSCSAGAYVKACCVRQALPRVAKAFAEPLADDRGHEEAHIRAKLGELTHDG